MRRQKELDADPKTVQQIEFVRQLKNINCINADGAVSMFVLTISWKIKETSSKFCQINVRRPKLKRPKLETSQDVLKTFSGKSKRPPGDHIWTSYLRTF